MGRSTDPRWVQCADQLEEITPGLGIHDIVLDAREEGRDFDQFAQTLLVALRSDVQARNTSVAA